MERPPCTLAACTRGRLDVVRTALASKSLALSDNIQAAKPSAEILSNLGLFYIVDVYSCLVLNGLFVGGV